MKEFLEFLEQNEEVKNRILALKGDPEASVKAAAIAKECGFDISEEIMEAERLSRFGKEISEDELKAVVGGETCFCPLVGGGNFSHKTQYTCACLVGGGGEYEDEDGDKQCRCACVAAGYGEDTY